MDGVCRTCMSLNKPVRSLFEVDSDFIELHVKLYTCFPTFNFDDSDFPKTMCTPCIKMLQSAYKFRELCIKSTSIFLKKRKDTKANNARENEAELNTKNEDMPNLISNNSTDISDQSFNKLNNPDTNHSKNEFDSNNTLGENNTPTEIINSISSVNDKTENQNNAGKNLEISESHVQVLNNANKKYIKVYPLNSVQTETFNVEEEIIDKNSQKETHNTISVQPPLLNSIGINLKNKEIQKEMNDKASENLFILQDLNSLDILVKHKKFIQNQVECLNNSDCIEENNLIVYRIDLVDQEDESNNLNSNYNCKISEINNENEDIRSESNLSKPQENTTTNQLNPPSIFELNNISEEKSKSSEVSDWTNETNNSNLNNESIEEDSSFENETNLLKPLEDYNLNNFINSSFTYIEEHIVKKEKNYEVDLIQETLEFQDEIELTANATDNIISAISETNNEHENNFELTASEIELPTNSEIKIKSVKSLNEQYLQYNTEVENSGDIACDLTHFLVKDIPVTTLTPIPITKLMSNNQNHENQTDEVDELVNKNVREVYDYSNHNDHTYAKTLNIESDTSHLCTSHLSDINVKRKRRLSVRLQISRDLKLSSPKSKEIEPNIISKKETNTSPSNPNNSGKNIIKKRGREKAFDKPTKDLTESDSSSNLVTSPNVLSESISNIIVKRPYGTRSSSAFDATTTTSTITTSTTTNDNKKVEWKVKKVRSKKNEINSFKIKIENIAVKTKIPAKEYKKMTRRRKKKKSKVEVEISTSTSEWKPIRKEQNEQTERKEEIPTKKPRIESIKNETSTSTSASKQTDFTAVNDDMDLEYPYECDLCNLRTNSMSSLEMHLSMHLNEDTNLITCKYCEKSFHNIHGYKVHQTRIHNKNPKQLNVHRTYYTCEICNKVFPSKRSCTSHKIVHKFKD